MSEHAAMIFSQQHNIFSPRLEIMGCRKTKKFKHFDWVIAELVLLFANQNATIWGIS